VKSHDRRVLAGRGRKVIGADLLLRPRSQAAVCKVPEMETVVREMGNGVETPAGPEYCFAAARDARALLFAELDFVAMRHLALLGFASVQWSCLH
jgi:hypothetical protein